MIRTTVIAALVCGLITTPAFAKKRVKNQEVQSAEKTDSVLQDYIKKDGEICYRQTVMITGGGRPKESWAKGAALRAWKAEVKKIHGVRFTDLNRANKPDGKEGKGAEVIPLPPEFGLTSYVVKGKPCAVSF